jgi:putative ABC transport system ATP-binding protein
MSTEITLQGIHLSQLFGTGELAVAALRDVSLELQAGRFSLLMGPSGSGKSTLLAVLSGLMRPSVGQVLALGQDVWLMSEPARRDFRLRHCAFIFQGYNLFPALTARQQLEMVLRWGEGASRRDARRRSEAMLDMLGLARKGDLLPAQLSGGEKQRVAIGRALIKRPSFCFADEPTSALDWEHGRLVVELLRDVAHAQQATVLVVSHDARLLPLSDQVFHLEDGRLKENASSGIDPLDTAGQHVQGGVL